MLMKGGMKRRKINGIFFYFSVTLTDCRISTHEQWGGLAGDGNF